MRKAYISPEIMEIESEAIEMLAVSQLQDLSEAVDYSEGGTLTGARIDDFFGDDDSNVDW